MIAQKVIHNCSLEHSSDFTVTLTIPRIVNIPKWPELKVGENKLKTFSSTVYSWKNGMVLEVKFHTFLMLPQVRYSAFHPCYQWYRYLRGPMSRLWSENSLWTSLAYKLHTESLLWVKKRSYLIIDLVYLLFGTSGRRILSWKLCLSDSYTWHPTNQPYFIFVRFTRMLRFGALQNF